MADTPDLNRLIPGFDFLQGLAKNATASLPAIGQWMTPTLDPADLERRIGELRTVQFWLEQNASMLNATIQALEVQRMTLSTLKTMNVQMEDLRDALQIRTPAQASAPAEVAGKAAADAAAPAVAPAPAGAAASGAAARAPAGAGAPAAAAAPGAALVDPMQWWGALTQQFSQLATAAMQDAPEAARSLAASRVQPARAAANDTLRASARPDAGHPAVPKGKAGKAAHQAAPGSAAPKGAASSKSPAPRKRPTR